MSTLWPWRSALTAPRIKPTLVPAALLAMGLAAGLLIARLSPLEGALAVGLVLCVLGTCLEPLVGVAAGLFLGLLRAYLHTEVPQVPEQIGQAFIVLALGVWLARGLRVRELIVRRSPVVDALALFVAAALVSLWNPVELPVYALPEFLKWVQMLLLCVLVSQTLTRRTLPRLVGGLLGVGLVQAGLGLWQFGGRGTGPDHFAILSLGEGFYRAYGTFEQPNPYGGYLALVLTVGVGVACAVLCVGRAGFRRRPWRWAFALLGYAAVLLGLGAGLLASWSRGAWMGFGAALLVMAVALPRRARWGVVLVVLIVVLGLALAELNLLPGSVAARLTGFLDYVRFEDVRGVGIHDANYSVVERFAHWQAALEMFRANFWTGVGIGNYEPAYADFALVNWPYALGHAHNFYLTVAAETGLIGLLAYLALWTVVVWLTWQATRRLDGGLRAVALGLLGAWTHLSVHHLLDNLLVNNVHLYIGVLLGILAFLVRQPAMVRPPRTSGNRSGRREPA